jgi:hypothetical protein
MRVTTFESQTVIAALTGAVALLGARINSTSQQKQERQATETERRHVFERETLIALQDALDELYRIVEESVLVRFPRAVDDDRVVELPHPPEPLSYRTVEASVDKLQGRVLDDDLRADVRAVRKAAGMVMTTKTKGAADDRGEELVRLSELITERIGERIRYLFTS